MHTPSSYIIYTYIYIICIATCMYVDIRDGFLLQAYLVCVCIVRLLLASIYAIFRAITRLAITRVMARMRPELYSARTCKRTTGTPSRGCAGVAA